MMLSIGGRRLSNKSNTIHVKRKQFLIRLQILIANIYGYAFLSIKALFISEHNGLKNMV